MSTPPSAPERRLSPRAPMSFQLRREGEAGAYESRTGDLSLGGFGSRGVALELGDKVEVRFLLPGHETELQARGEVLRESEGPDGVMAQVRFIDLSVEAELAIAKYLHDRELTGGAT